MYFFDAEHGLVGTGIAPGVSSSLGLIFRTSDGGRTWTQAHTPKSYTGVMDIFFRDSQHGWAAVGGGVYTLWRTNDGGDNWTEVLDAKGSYGVGAYETSTSLILTDIYTYSRLAFDKNSMLFNRVSLNKASDAMLGVDFTDDQHGVITSYRNGGKWVRTSDGGKTWVETDISSECWSVYGEKGTSRFYAAAEGNNLESITSSEVYRSDDNGATWKTMTTLPFRTTGHITGVGSTLYIQTNSTSCLACQGYANGIYHSTDGGSTWSALGGPDNVEDRRFKAVKRDCRTNLVFAADNLGNLYSFIDSVKPVTPTDLHADVIPTLEAPVAKGRLSDVPVDVQFESRDNITSDLLRLKYTLQYPVEITVADSLSWSRTASVIPPAGWSVVSVQSDSDKLHVVIERSTTSLSFTNEISLGSVRSNFANSGAKKIAVRILGFSLMTMCDTNSIPVTLTSNIAAYITPVASGVASQIENSELLMVQPNPARDVVKLMFSNPEQKKASIKILDILGRTIYERTGAVEENQINTSAFAPGSYTVQMLVGNEIVTKKLEIVR